VVGWFPNSRRQWIEFIVVAILLLWLLNRPGLIGGSNS